MGHISRHGTWPVSPGSKLYPSSNIFEPDLESNLAGKSAILSDQGGTETVSNCEGPALPVTGKRDVQLETKHEPRATNPISASPKQHTSVSANCIARSKNYLKRHCGLLTDIYYHLTLGKKDQVFQMVIREGKEPQYYCLWDICAGISLASRTKLEEEKIRWSSHDEDVPAVKARGWQGPEIETIGYARIRWSGGTSSRSRESLFYVTEHSWATCDFIVGKDFIRGKAAKAASVNLIDIAKRDEIRGGSSLGHH